jgi:IS30 family transposase
MKKIRYNDELENYIREKLKLKRTPQLIAGAWSKEHPEYKIGHMSVYKYIYSRF